MSTPEQQSQDLIEVQQQVISITEDMAKQLVVALARTKADLARFQTYAVERAQALEKMCDENRTLTQQLTAIKTGGTAPQARDGVRGGSDVPAPADLPVAA